MTRTRIIVLVLLAVAFMMLVVIPMAADLALMIEEGRK